MTALAGAGSYVNIGQLFLLIPTGGGGADPAVVLLGHPTGDGVHTGTLGPDNIATQMGGQNLTPANLLYGQTVWGVVGAVNVPISPSGNDPYSISYAALWNALNASVAFRGLALPGNQLRWDIAANRQPAKPQLQAADFPQVGIAPTKLIPAQSSASSAKVLWNLRCGVVTGDQRLTQGTFPLEWEFTRQVYSLHDAIEGAPWVRKVRILDGQDALMVENGESGQVMPKGWQTFLIIQLELWFTAADLA